MASRFVRNSIFGSISGSVITLGSFVSSLIIARLLGVKATGEVAFAMWLVNVLHVVSAFGLPFSASRYLPELCGTGDDRQARQLGLALFQRFAALSIVPALLCVALSLGTAYWPGYVVVAPFDNPLIDLLIGACCLAQAFSEFAKAYLRGMRQFDRLARLTIIGATIQIATLTLGALCLGVEGALIGYLVGGFPVVVALLDFVHVTPFVAETMRARLLRYSRFRWLAEILALFVWTRFEILFLQMFWGLKEVGVFAVGLTLANAAVQGPLTLTWGMMPHFSETIARGDMASAQRAYEKATRTLAFLVFPACFGLAAISDRVIALLYGHAFAASSLSAAILVGGAAFAATGSIGTNLILATERSDIDLINGVAGALLSIVGGLFLIHPLGPLGAAMSRVTVQGLVVLVSSWFLIRELKIKIPVAAIFRFALAAAVCAICAHALASAIPGFAGVVDAILAGIIVYLMCVRALSAFTPDDAATLHGLGRSLPRPLSRGFGFLVTVTIG